MIQAEEQNFTQEYHNLGTHSVYPVVRHRQTGLPLGRTWGGLSSQLVAERVAEQDFQHFCSKQHEFDGVTYESFDFKPCSSDCPSRHWALDSHAR